MEYSKEIQDALYEALKATKWFILNENTIALNRLQILSDINEATLKAEGK